MSYHNQIPEEKGIDHTISLIREGYMFISNRCHSFNSPIFKTRILGKPAICMVGKEAAEIFYDPDKFKRKNVAPNRAKQTLFGKNSVQTLDGPTHKHRKEMLMSIMTQTSLKKLTTITKTEWERAIHKWKKQQNVLLYEEAKEIMCRAACEWVGIRIKEHEVRSLSKDLAAMFESAGAIGPNHWRGRQARNRVEKRIAELVDNVRNVKEERVEHTILHKFASYRDLEGNLLDKKTVAVEIINLLRPIVEISIYINFIALAAYHFPMEREKVKFGDEENAFLFVQEVRRFYPFFPFAMAKVKQGFIWNGYQFDKDTLTLLDLYGTNHDSSIWKNPNLFLPERFMKWEEDPFSFIPQGGGDYFIGHRCAGEWMTTQIMKVSLDFLVNQINYEVPKQDLSFSMVNMPSIPRSKVIISNVQLQH